jgi:hypothetical protein
VRDNTSRILGRIVRGYEGWIYAETRRKLDEMLDTKFEEDRARAERKRPGSSAIKERPSLCVAVYRTTPARPGDPGYDFPVKTVVLTRGNGAQHAIVVLDPEKVSFDLEMLAAGQVNINVEASHLTRVVVPWLGLYWVLLLITAASIKTNYLLIRFVFTSTN